MRCWIPALVLVLAAACGGQGGEDATDGDAAVASDAATDASSADVPVTDGQGAPCKTHSDCPAATSPCELAVCAGRAGCVTVQLPDGAPCDDGDKCTLADRCEAAQRAPGTAKNCDDGNPCRDDTCDKETGACKHWPAANVTCDDGNPCTKGEFCTAGECVSADNVCTCEKTADCAKKEDGDKCNGTLYCDKTVVPYTCEVNPATIVNMQRDRHALQAQRVRQVHRQVRRVQRVEQHTLRGR